MIWSKGTHQSLVSALGGRGLDRMLGSGETGPLSREGEKGEDSVKSRGQQQKMQRGGEPTTISPPSFYLF